MYGEHERRSVSNLAKKTPSGIHFDCWGPNFSDDGLASEVVVESPGEITGCDGKSANLSPLPDITSGDGAFGASSALVSFLNRVGPGPVNRRLN